MSSQNSYWSSEEDDDEEDELDPAISGVMAWGHWWPLWMQHGKWP